MIRDQRDQRDDPAEEDHEADEGGDRHEDRHDAARRGGHVRRDSRRGLLQLLVHLPELPAHVPLLAPPLAVPAMVGLIKVFFCAVDDVFGVEGHAEGRGTIFRGVRIRHDDQHRDVDEERHTGEQREDDEADAHPGHVEAHVRGEPVAHAAPHRALADLEQALARFGVEGRRGRVRCAAGGGGIGRLLVGGFHRTHLGDDAFHFRGAHDSLVRA